MAEETIKEQKKDVDTQHRNVHTLADDIEYAKTTGVLRKSSPTEVEALHTLSSDLTSALYEKKGTVIKLALAEEEKRRMLEEGREPYSKQNIFFLIATTILVIAGIGLIIFMYIRKNPTVDTNTQISLPAYVFTDGNITVPIVGKTKEDARVLIRGAAHSIKDTETVVGIYPINNTTTDTALVSFSQFNDILSLQIPTAVTQQILGTFMIGAYRDAGIISPFLLLKTQSSEDTRNAIMQWEPTMYESVMQSTGMEVNPILIGKDFENAIIRNKDARVLREENGKIILLYTFIDKYTLLITSSPNVVAMAIDRLNVERITK